MGKTSEFMICPVCGMRSPVERLHNDYSFAVYTREMGGRTKDGKPILDWALKKFGYRQLKERLILILEKQIARMDPLNGCDFYPDCCECPRELNECPDQQRGLKQKMGLNTRKDRIAALRVDGWTINQIAEEIGKSPRTVQRALGGKRK